jgi:1,2-diacylglycerol 3-beta-glucosyltransferase
MDTAGGRVTLVPIPVWLMLDLLLAALSVPVLLGALYLAALALASRRIPPSAATDATITFDVIVPAHDEERVVAETVASLLGVDYPRERFRVWVVADNCTDATAAVAREAGALVLERRDESRRGKGYALAHGFEHTDDGFGQVVVVVDADTLVSPNLLGAFAARVAQGEACLQADYGVRNPEASWRTRLMTLAFALNHVVRSLARERWGVSCGLRGNGMAFTRTTLARVPHDAFSIVEDVEYGIRLGQAGIRVAYASNAHVWGEMVTGEAASRSQRQRWEAGRHALRKKHSLPLLRAAWRQRSGLLLDLGIDLLVPPLTSLVLAVASLWLAGTGLAVLEGRVTATLVTTTIGAVGLLAYVARGWWLSGVPLVRVLASAPAFVIWKLRLRASRGGPGGEWVRTTREDRP